jgi:hypothetical protein
MIAEAACLRRLSLAARPVMGLCTLSFSTIARVGRASGKLEATR